MVVYLMFADTMHVNFVQLADVVQMQIQIGHIIVWVVGPVVLHQDAAQVEVIFILWVTLGILAEYLTVTVTINM